MDAFPVQQGHAKPRLGLHALCAARPKRSDAGKSDTGRNDVRNDVKGGALFKKGWLVFKGKHLDSAESRGGEKDTTGRFWSVWRDEQGKEPIRLVLANTVRFTFDWKWLPIVTGGRGGRAVYELGEEQHDATSICASV